MDETRRSFIGKTAMAGGLVWAAPAVLTVAPASAQTLYGPCACQGCEASATGLVDVVSPPATVRPTAPCVNPADGGLCCQNDVRVTPATAKRVCAKADNATCSASVVVEGLRGRLTPTLYSFQVGFLSSCVECGTGSTGIADIFVVRHPPGQPETLIPVPVPTGCNQTVSAESFSFIFNEQTCQDGVLTVTGLRTTGMGAIPIVVAQSRAGACCTFRRRSPQRAAHAFPGGRPFV